ncbi:2-dehydro-3-deoxygluconokinase [Herbaspirillum rubrisubalbicans]|uniref:2-dehydro-3-deoxygluconokinase n=1 Tax=Herbaspirillum rubrisubalbicans TaxID=80842 RepID=A0ABX9C1I2_9BURK|nr:sugar kinase [Herbaspirillum rubrisubalbicans]MCP1576913.1 2-dehydro-3-deoxygluconokinase [Herbaspirillum rubrisubalbicans]NQE49267.1 2-dehydro-3-deoxygluconokinase [Herbaspirillum rubrisubalbicans]RAM64229.1 2-dehydro-3-deoxygluconokinase [Herbaspirillum rubrisubalbicans]RAN49774.1 2-dehydro-3-deoxygluconokinase [Herbaspirillum rubrisubalbicans]
MTMQLDVVTWGEALALLVADEVGPFEEVERYTRRLAGAETNVAIGLARLGLKVGWASRVGNDAFGRFIRKRVAAEGVDVSRVLTDMEFRTAIQLKAKAVDGADPAIEYYRKGSAASHLSLADFDADYFGAARHLHATGIAPALSPTTMAFAHHAMEVMRAAGKTISFDPNLRPMLWPSKEVMAQQLNALAFKADWVLPGLSEGKILTGYEDPREIAGFYLERDVKMVVIKLGAEGAYWRTGEGEGRVAGVPVKEVVDTVGAGDGFAVGVISGMLEGLPVAQAVMRGNRIGAFAIQVVGDMEGLPTRAELDAASA